MPRIREYTENISAAGPSPIVSVSGDDLGSGKGLQRLGAQVGNFAEVVNKAETQAEISNLSVEISRAQVEFTRELNEKLRAGETDTEKFSIGYDEHIAKLDEKIETAGGRQFLKRSSATMKAHLMQTAMRGQIEIAGAKAIKDHDDMMSNFSSGLLGDPSSFEAVTEVYNGWVDNAVKNGNLSFVQGEELRSAGKRELSKSMVRGWNDLDPVGTKARIENGDFDDLLDGNVKRQMIGEADQEIRGRRADAALEEQAREKALQEAQKRTADNFVTKIVEGKLTAREVIRSNLDPGQKEHYVKWLEQSAAGNPMKTDPAVFLSLFNRINADDGDPNKILDEKDLNSYVGKGIGFEELNRLRGEFQGRYTSEGKEIQQARASILKAARSKLTKSNPMVGISDPDGDANYAAYVIKFNEDLSKGRQAGKPLKDLLDPNSKDYIGASLSSFVKTPQQMVQSQLNAMKLKTSPIPEQTGSPPASTGPKKKDGETPAEFLRRIKKGSG